MRQRLGYSKTESWSNSERELEFRYINTLLHCTYCYPTFIRTFIRSAQGIRLKNSQSEPTRNPPLHLLHSIFPTLTYSPAQERDPQHLPPSGQANGSRPANPA